MYVIKANGERQRFDKNKIVKTCIRAELSVDDAKKIANIVEKKVKEGTTTRKIYDMILQEMEKFNQKAPFLYRLRESVARLDPEIFEIYVEKLLEEHGYKCEWNKIIKGEVVEHQVDIIAKNKMNYLVECKKHFNPHRDCGLGETMEVWARLDDINRGSKYKFGKAWIITNTKFSEHAKRYANGKGMRLTGWKYRGSDSLEKMVQTKKFYPVTILRTDKRTIGVLANNGFVSIKQVVYDEKRFRKLRIINNHEDILKQAKSIL